MEEEEKGMSLFTGAVLLGVVLAALTVGVWWKKTNVLELLVLGVVYWLCTWVISGMGLFVLDQFSLRRCVIAAVSVELLVGIAAEKYASEEDLADELKLPDPYVAVRLNRLN